jgi:hypothetical protein
MIATWRAASFVIGIATLVSAFPWLAAAPPALLALRQDLLPGGNTL